MQAQAEIETSHEYGFDGITRELEMRDIRQLQPTLETAFGMKTPEGHEVNEVRRTMLHMASSVLNRHNSKQYFVAETRSGDVVGAMGYKPAEGLLSYSATPNPVELILNVVHPYHPPKEIMSGLLDTVEDATRESGRTEILVNAEPGYKQSTWILFSERYGEPLTCIPNEKNETSAIWRVDLTKQPARNNGR